MNDSDTQHLMSAAQTLTAARQARARARLHVRAVLDAMAAEARRTLGTAFTVNDPLTNFAVAIVARSDERLPDDYDTVTPRPSTDTVNRLIVEVLGHVVTIEITDDGSVDAQGDVPDVPLADVTDIRVADGANAPTFLVTRGKERHDDAEIPFVRVLAQLIDAAAAEESAFSAQR